MPQSQLTPEQVLTWMANNPDGLRLASAEAAREVLHGPEVAAALAVLGAALAVNQDGAAVSLTEPNRATLQGSRETLTKVIQAIAAAQSLVTARADALKPAAPGEEDPVPPTD